MKKQLKCLVAVLAVTAMATPAFALTVDTKGFVEIRGQYDHNLTDGTSNYVRPLVGLPAGQSVGNDDDRTGIDQRLRLWTEAAADENVKAVFAIEYDSWWGDTFGGDIGSDGKGQLEVKHMYLDFNLPSAKTNVKAGTQYFKIANGYIAGDDATGVQTATKFGDAATLKLYYVKAIEGDFKVTSDDINFYGAQVDVKAGPLTVSPILAWTRNGKNTDIYFGGFDLAGKFGENTKLNMTLVKNWGDDTSPGQNVDGTAAYLGLFQAMGKVDLSLEGAWIGDDGRDDGEFVDGSGTAASGTTNGAWGLSSPTEMLGGARYDARGGVGQALGTSGGNTGANLYVLNQAYVKLGFGFKTSDTTKLTTYLAHIQQASGANDGMSNAFGQEVGAYYDIALAKGLNFNLMGAYLFNDDFTAVNPGDTPGYDDVWKLGTALTYKF